MYERIFTPGKIGNVEIKNRVVLSSMEETLGQASGEISERAIEYYAAKAKGGVGLVIAAYIAVTDHELCGLGKAGQIHLWNLDDRRAMALCADRVHEYGGKLFCQLHHPGRRTKPSYNKGVQPMSATALPSKMVGKIDPCHEMTIDEIKRVEDAYATAAEHAFWAGADGVEIHCGHFYLLHQFLCPIRNERTDEYGGSMENRCRIVDNIIDKIRAKTTDNFAITLRVHLFDEEGYEGGLSIEDMLEICKHFEAKGVDGFDFSIGNQKRTGTPDMKFGWRSAWLKRFHDELNVPIYGNNDTKTPEEAESLLADGITDFVIMGRQLNADNEWPNKAKAGKADEIRPCISCNYCVYRVNAEDKQIRCAVNPTIGREYDCRFGMEKGEGTIMVIGAGPAGIQAATTLTERGYKVKMFDKRGEVGGSMNLANKAPNKFRMEGLRQYYTRYVENNPNIELHLNTEVTPALMDEWVKEDPYAVVLACGGQPIVPTFIPGYERGIPAFDILNSKVQFTGKKVAVVGGGMTGLETAEKLAEEGNEVTIIEMKPILGDGVFVANVFATQDFLKARGAKWLTNAAVKEIKEDCVIVEPHYGKFISAGLNGVKNRLGYIPQADPNLDPIVPCDEVVLALGTRKDTSMAAELNARFSKVVMLGDCTNPGRIGDATGAAFLAAKEL